MLRRLIFGFGANALGQAINIIIQIFSLPLFLTVWDASTYGTWLLLSAIPAYLVMADIGIVNVAGNKMTMAIGRGNVVEANAVFQSAQLFVTVVSIGLAIVLTCAALTWPAAGFTLDMRLALAALLCSVLVSLSGGLADAVFKATGRYAFGTSLDQLARLLEWGGLILGLFVFRSFAGVAFAGLSARAIAVAILITVAQRGDHGLVLGFRHADRGELTSMLRPAVSFMAFPLANALSFQGVTLVVGLVAGTSETTVFMAYRTLARVAVQLTSMFSLALWPEFSRSVGQVGMAGVHPLFRRSALLGAGIAALSSPLLYVLSPWLLTIWTHGRIEFRPDLMALLLVYAAIGGFWHVPRVLLMSTNRHVGLSGWSLATGLVCVGLAWLLGRQWQSEGVAAAMLLSELFIAAVCIYLANRSFVEPPRQVHQARACVRKHRRRSLTMGFFKQLKQLFIAPMVKRLPVVLVGTADQWAIPAGSLAADAFVVSAGVGKDITFEQDLVARFGVRIILLDPSPTGIKTIAKRSLPRNIEFHALGLAAQAGSVSFGHPDRSDEGSFRKSNVDGGVSFDCTTLQELMSQHNRSRIDLLKIDVEGFEYEIINSILAKKSRRAADLRGDPPQQSYFNR